MSFHCRKVALCQSPPSFSVLCYPCPYHSLLPHNVISLMTFWSSDWSYTLYLTLHSVLLIVHLLSFILAMCPAHFHFVLVMYWTMSVTLVLCLMMVFRILSFSLTLSIFLSIARWLVSSLFTNAFVRDHVCHPYVIAGKTHWLKTFFLDSWEGTCPGRFLCTFQKHSILLLFWLKLLVSFCSTLLLFVPDIYS